MLKNCLPSSAPSVKSAVRFYHPGRVGESCLPKVPAAVILNFPSDAFTIVKRITKRRLPPPNKQTVAVIGPVVQMSSPIPTYLTGNRKLISWNLLKT